jgi:poly(A) polymerase
MIEHHLRPTQMSQNVEMPTAKAIYRFYRDLDDAATDTLYLNMADYLAARGANLNRGEWEAHCDLIGHILREGLAPKTSGVRPKLLDGHDIMETFALEPGPKIGALLELVQEAQASGEIATRGAAMELVKARLGSGGDSA